MNRKRKYYSDLILIETTYSISSWMKKVYQMLLYLDVSMSTFETKASYSWCMYISSWRKKSLKKEQAYYLKQYTIYILSFHGWKSLSNVTLPWFIHVNIWDESIIFLIEYTLYQFMKEKSLSNVTLPWCINLNIETKASYSWLNTCYISSWRKKVYQM